VRQLFLGAGSSRTRARSNSDSTASSSRGGGGDGSTRDGQSTAMLEPTERRPAPSAEQQRLAALRKEMAVPLPTVAASDVATYQRCGERPLGGNLLPRCSANAGPLGTWGTARARVVATAVVPVPALAAAPAAAADDEQQRLDTAVEYLHAGRQTLLVDYELSAADRALYEAQLQYAHLRGPIDERGAPPPPPLPIGDLALAGGGGQPGLLARRRGRWRWRSTASAWRTSRRRPSWTSWRS